MSNINQTASSKAKSKYRFQIPLFDRIFNDSPSGREQMLINLSDMLKTLEKMNLSESSHKDLKESLSQFITHGNTFIAEKISNFTLEKNKRSNPIF